MRNAVLFALVCLLLAITMTFPLANARNSIPDLNIEFGTKNPPQTSAIDPKVNPVSRIIVKTSVKLTTQVMDILRSYALNVNSVLEKLNAVAMTVKTSTISELQELDIVKWVEQDAERYALSDFKNGLSTWNLDMINTYSEPGYNKRQVSYDGTGVYVAVLDTGLVKNWRDYFHEDRIAEEYAKAFLAASWEKSPTETPEIPGNAWERDTEGHGTHVTSTILGYWLGDNPIGGVAPLAQVIPVKVLHNSGFGWSSAIAKGIFYIAELKQSGAITNPIVISMSLGGPVGSQIEHEAIDYAIEQGVPVVAASGNKGENGMDYPGAYSEVISVGACGWTKEWAKPDGTFGNYGWWTNLNVPDPTPIAEVYITDFSGREKTDQDLDVVAPGSWVLGPYLLNGASRAKGEYWFLGGTSMATPHVSGIVALMLQKDMNDGDQDLLNAWTSGETDIEGYLQSNALAIPPNTIGVWIWAPSGNQELASWGSDATGSGLVQADAVLAALPP